MSKYDSIKTAAELVEEVQLNGLSMAQEDICRAQDIFGITSVDELARLANDIGMNNDNGEPDPKGTWSSGRRATQGTFYMIVSNIWSWEEVTRFWNLYTNPESKELKELRQKHIELKMMYEGSLNRNSELKRMLEEEAGLVMDLQTRVGDAQRAAEDAEDEIIRLKAKLYDLLVERKEAV